MNKRQKACIREIASRNYEGEKKNIRIQRPQTLLNTDHKTYVDITLQRLASLAESMTHRANDMPGIQN